MLNLHTLLISNLNSIGEEEIISDEKKYETILDYCLSIPNTPKYPNKIFNYETKIKTTKRNTLEI